MTPHRSIWVFAVVTGFLVLIGVATSTFAQFQINESAPATDEQSVAVESDSPSQGIDRFDRRVAQDPRRTEQFHFAQKLAERRRWDECAQQLQVILDETTDSLISSDGRVWRPVTDATVDLARKHPELLEAYERRFGPIAVLELNEAERRNDIPVLSRISQRYLLTSAGQAASRIVVDLSLDLGNIEYAARQVSRLRQVNSPHLADEAWRSQLSLALKYGGYEELARELSEATDPSGSPSDVLSVWSLERFANSPKALGDWHSLAGQKAGFHVALLNESILLPKWSNSLLKWPRHGEVIRDIQDNLDDQGVLGFSVLSVVGDSRTIVVRSLAGLTAFDLESGQVLWRYERLLNDLMEPSPHGFDEDEPVEPSFENYDPWSSLDYGIRQHLFEEAATGTLSASSRSLFTIEYLDPSAEALSDFIPSGYGDEEIVPAHLLARDLLTGRIQWRAGGPATRELPGLPAAGVYFFGPPIADGGDLFVVGERSGDILLFCLEAETGLVSWEQLIATSGRRIEQDSVRRCWTAPVALQGSLVICPTTTGWVTAVDRVTRTIVWSSRLPPPTPSGDSAEGGVDYDSTNRVTGIDERWPPTQPMVLRDRVVIAPVEFPDELGLISPGLFCLDLKTGRKLWETLKDRWVGVAGADEQAIYLFESHSVTAIDSQTGKPLWSTVVPSLVSARPVLTTIGLIVPTVKEGLIRIEPRTGKVLAPALSRSSKEFERAAMSTVRSTLDSPTRYGNLYTVGGRLISATPTELTTFEWASEPPVWEQESGENVDAALHWARYLKATGRLTDAEQVLRRARQLPQLTPVVKESLRKELFDVMTMVLADGLHHATTTDKISALWKEADEVAVEPREHELVKRLSIDWQLRTGEMDAAWHQLRPLIGSPLQFEVQSEREILQPDTWLAERLRQLAQLGTVDQRLAIRKRLRDEFEHAWRSSANGTVQQDRLLRVFSEMPFIEQFELDRALADQSTDSIPRLEALSQSSRRDISLPATLRLLQLMSTSDWKIDAQQKFDRLPPVDQWPAEHRIRHSEIARQLEGIQEQPPPESWLDLPLEVIRQGNNYDVPQLSELHGTDLPIVTLGEPCESVQHFRFTYQEILHRVQVTRADGSLFCEWGLIGRDRADVGWGAPVIYTHGRTVYLIHQRIIHAFSLATKRQLWHRQTASRYEHDPNWYRSSGAGTTKTPAVLVGRVELEDASNRYPLFEAAGPRHVVVRSKYGFQVLCAQSGTLLWEIPRCPIEATRCQGNVLIRLRSDTSAAYSLCTGRSLNCPEFDGLVARLNPLDRCGLTTLRESPSEESHWTLQGWNLRPTTIDSAPVDSTEGWDAGDALRLVEGWTHDVDAACLMGEGHSGVGVILEPEGSVSLMNWFDGRIETLGITSILKEPSTKGEDQSPRVRILLDRTRLYLMANGTGEDSLLECSSLPIEGYMSTFPRNSEGTPWEFRGSGAVLYGARLRLPFLPIIRTQPIEIASYTNQRIELTLIDNATGKTVFHLDTPSWGSGVSSMQYDATRRQWELSLNGERLRLQQRPADAP